MELNARNVIIECVSPLGMAADRRGFIQEDGSVIIIIHFLNLYSGFKAKSACGGLVIWIKKSTGKILAS